MAIPLSSIPSGLGHELRAKPVENRRYGLVTVGRAAVTERLRFGRQRRCARTLGMSLFSARRLAGSTGMLSACLKSRPETDWGGFEFRVDAVLAARRLKVELRTWVSQPALRANLQVGYCDA